MSAAGDSHEDDHDQDGHGHQRHFQAVVAVELRGLGRNLHPRRFDAPRGRRWRATLLEALASLAVPGRNDGRIATNGRAREEAEAVEMLQRGRP